MDRPDLCFSIVSKIDLQRTPLRDTAHKKNARSELYLYRGDRIYVYGPGSLCFASRFQCVSFPNNFHLFRSVRIIFRATMITLLSDHYVPQPVTKNDLQIASLAWGFTIGFGFLTTWTAIRQSADVTRRYGYWKLNSPYIWMIWLEILVCLIFSVICWLHLNDVIPPRYYRTASLSYSSMS